jgi:hypothetical protein
MITVMNRETLRCLKGMILRVVEPPKAGFVTRFWPREIKLAKELYQKTPDDLFWSKIQFGFKLNSLAWLKTDAGSKALQLKHKEFYYKPPERPESPQDQLSDRKFGETLHNQKPRTFVRDFLN